MFDGYDAHHHRLALGAAQYRRDLGRRLDHGVVVRNGVPEPRSLQSRAQVRHALGIPADVRVVAQVARVIEYKGQLQLLRAAAEVLSHAPDVWFLICGYSSAAPAFAAQLQQRSTR